MTQHPINRYPAALRPHLWAPERRQQSNTPNTTPNPQPPKTGPLAASPSWRLGTPRGRALNVDLVLALATVLSGGGGVFLLLTNGFLIR